MLLEIIWNINPVAIDIGPLQIKWYSIFWMVTLVGGYYIATRLCRHEGVPDDKMIDVIGVVFISGLIGARFGQVLFYELDYFLANPEQILAIWKGGLASHGGAVGILVGLWIYSKVSKHHSFIWLLDGTAIIMAANASLIRLGNLFNSELVGIPSQAPWAFVFSHVDTVPRHPVVLYEAMAYALIFIGLFLLHKRLLRKIPGLYASIFLTSIFAIRFLLEFFKEGDPGIIAGISRTQSLSIPIVALGIGWLAFAISRSRKSTA